MRFDTGEIGISDVRHVDVPRIFHMSELKFLMSARFHSPPEYQILLLAPFLGSLFLDPSLRSPVGPSFEPHGKLPLDLPLNPLLGPPRGPLYPSLGTLMDIIIIRGMWNVRVSDGNRRNVHMSVLTSDIWNFKNCVRRVTFPPVRFALFLKFYSFIKLKSEYLNPRPETSWFGTSLNSS